MSIRLVNLKENPFSGNQFAWEDIQSALLWCMLILIGIPALIWLLFQEERWVLLLCVDHRADSLADHR
jgi:bacteriorhodopsin